LLKKSDLPKEVKLCTNFFEKMKNIFVDANLRHKFQINGEIKNYFSNNSKQTLDALSKSLSNQIVLSEVSKKSIKMLLKLEQSSDHVFTGFRIKLDFNNKSVAGIQAKLFNRVVRFKSKTPIWFDVPFCDAEVIYGCNQNVEIELSTDDVQNSPIKIYAMEFFATHRKDF